MRAWIYLLFTVSTVAVAILTVQVFKVGGLRDAGIYLLFVLCSYLPSIRAARRLLKHEEEKGGDV